jgi:hypothetical protein
LIVIVNTPQGMCGLVLDREGGAYNIQASENGNGLHRDVMSFLSMIFSENRFPLFRIML